MDDLTSLFLFLSGFLVVFAIIMLIPYILMAIGLKTIADRQGIENSWLAFVPIAQNYIMGEIVDDRLGGNGGVKFLAITLGGLVLSIIPFIGAIIPFGLIVFYFVTMHWIFQRYSEKAVIMTVFNVLTGLVFGSIGIFVIRNNPDLLEPEHVVLEPEHVVIDQ